MILGPALSRNYNCLADLVCISTQCSDTANSANVIKYLIERRATFYSSRYIYKSCFLLYGQIFIGKINTLTTGGLKVGEYPTRHDCSTYSMNTYWTSRNVTEWRKAVQQRWSVYAQRYRTSSLTSFQHRRSWPRSSESSSRPNNLTTGIYPLLSFKWVPIMFIFIQGASEICAQTSRYCSSGQKNRKTSYNCGSIEFH